MISLEILTTLGVGIAIIAVVVPAVLYLSARIDDVNKRIDEQAKETNRSFDEQAKETNRRFDEMNRRFDEQAKETSRRFEDVAGRIGRQEGLLEGLRDLLTGKRASRNRKAERKECAGSASSSGNLPG